MFLSFTKRTKLEELLVRDGWIKKIPIYYYLTQSPVKTKEQIF